MGQIESDVRPLGKSYKPGIDFDYGTILSILIGVYFIASNFNAIMEMRPNEPHNHNTFMIAILVKFQIIDFIVEYFSIYKYLLLREF